VFVTSSHDGAERGRTLEGAGGVQPVKLSVRYLEVGRSLKEDGGKQESSRFPVAVVMASWVM
jgi:hypothetical protein